MANRAGSFHRVAGLIKSPNLEAFTMLKCVIRLACLSLASAMSVVPAFAQDAESLKGHWTGIIDEPGSIPQYTLSVHINLDRNGHPVGLVQYDAFPCAGVWSNAVKREGSWTFDETIAIDTRNCAEHVTIELRPNGNALDVRLGPSTLTSSGRLTRRPNGN